MANYPLPAWLEPSAAQGWGDLAARGQQLQLERARIQQEGVNASMEAQARQQAQQAEANRQQQQIQYQTAYRNAELGLRQQSIDDQEQKFQEQVKTAATKASAMMRISQRIAAGEDPSTVYMQEGPAAGMTADAMSKLKTGPAALIPKEITMDDGTRLIETSNNHYTILKPSTPKTPPADTVTVRQVPNPNFIAGKTPEFLTLTNKTTHLPAGGTASATAVKGRSSSAPSQKDIDWLKKHPDLKDRFDAEFGAGAANGILAPSPSLKGQNQDEEDVEPETP